MLSTPHTNSNLFHRLISLRERKTAANVQPGGDIFG